MTKAQSEVLKRWTQQWAERLGLGGWQVTLYVHDRAELPPEISEGEVQQGRLSPHHARRWAEVSVAYHARLESPREIAVHELVHLVLSEMMAATQALEEHLAPDLYALFRAQYDGAEEIAVHRLTRALLPRRQRRGR